MIKANFGWIPYEIEFENRVFSLSLLPEYSKNVSYINESKSPVDNYYYPPIENCYKVNLIDNSEEKIPNTQREAFSYPLPVTHQIEIKISNKKYNIQFMNFLIYFIGFLYGYRTQIQDINIDGRFKAESSIYHAPPPSLWLENNIYKVIKFWNKLNRRDIIVITNALFLYNRTEMYKWDWESFTIEYQVFDAIYKLANNNCSIKAKSHSKRFDVLCNKFNILYDKEVIKTIIKLRNDLIHEVLWDGKLPTIESLKGINHYHYLRRLNEKLIFAIMDFKGEFIEAPWSAHVTQIFDLE